jgi:hypothetical protein
MATSRSPWKGRERQAAALLGARRQALSGSAGRPDRSASDSTRIRLYMEVKPRQKHTVHSLYAKVKTAAGREKTIPVLVLASKRRPGHLLVVASRDLPLLGAACAAANLPDGNLSGHDVLGRIVGEGHPFLTGLSEAVHRPATDALRDAEADASRPRSSRRGRPGVISTPTSMPTSTAGSPE